MPEAARNLDEENENGSSQGPNLRAIEGGGQGSGEPRGNLRAVTNGAQRAKAPIRRAWGAAREKTDQAGQAVVDGTVKLNEWTHDTLRYEIDKDAEQKDLFFPPEAALFAAGDIIDGTVLNTARRAVDVIEPGMGTLRAAYRGITRPILHPIDTLTKPVRYLSNPVRGVTSSVKMAKNIALTPTRALKDFGDRSVRRATQRFGKIPLIGPITGGVAKAASWVLEKPNQIAEWPTKWVDAVDEKVAEFQNA
ncbi:hypothetical protein HN709_02700 [Candidatus Peregrinibacteria bacterium]|jgi:hypothetical protein|nr:hypothetical protein [Candidatus Peregrinibacteria bacterium]MBT7736573.1 hypothetical protein [Candidatus Peregrinibacteria bacterium]